MTLRTKIAIVALTAIGAAGFALAGNGSGNNAAPLTLVAARSTAPDFISGGQWFNSEPLTIRQLRGKVVLVDFWTYGCINCVRTLPYVTKLHDKYKDKGLVIVGVHTPEFPFERSASNVQTALKRHGITYPVVQDNDSATWNAYSNQYWPAQYIVDQNGQIIYTHAGEGAYEDMDRLIGKLLNATS